MPGAAKPAAVARAEPRAVRSTSRSDRSQATDAPAPRSPAGGSGAADDPAAPAPPGSRSRPGDLSDDPTRASASRSMPALVTGNQTDGGFYEGFFRSLLSRMWVRGYRRPRSGHWRNILIITFNELNGGTR